MLDLSSSGQAGRNHQLIALFDAARRIRNGWLAGYPTSRMVDTVFDLMISSAPLEYRACTMGNIKRRLKKILNPNVWARLDDLWSEIQVRRTSKSSRSLMHAFEDSIDRYVR